VIARATAVSIRVVTLNASLTERRLLEAQAREQRTELPADGRPLPSVAAYDDLLRHPATGTGAPS